MTAARFDLDDTDTAPDRAPAARSLARPLVIAVAATAIIAALVTGAVVWRARQPAAPSVQRFAIMPTADAPIAVETNHPDVSITPDGSRLVYFSQVGEQNQFALRPLDRFEPTILKNLGELPRGLTVSPDGEWVTYQSGAATGAGAALYKVPIAGGAPTRLCDIPGNLRGTTWATNDTIVFASANRAQGLLRVSAAGGTFEVLTTPRGEDDETDHLWPEGLPDGKHVLFAITRASSTDIGLLALDTKTWRVLIKNGISPRYSSTGHIVFGSAGVLKAVPFDLERLEVTGEPVQVLAGVMMKESGAADFALSRNGTLVYLPGQVQSVQRQLTWRDASGHDTPLALAAADYSSLQISPDGRFAAALVGVTSGANDSELWLIDLSREVASRLTPRGFSAGFPVWSQDSQRIAVSSGKEPGGIFVVSAAGTTAPERLTTAPVGELHLPGSWSNDAILLFSRWTADRRDADIMQVAVASGDVKPVVAGSTLDSQPALSRDSHWLAYTSFDQYPRLFIRPFPNVNDIKIPVTTGAAQYPAWSVDGRTLYYRSNRNVSLVAVTPSGGSLTIGAPEVPPAWRQLSVTETTFIATPPVNNRFLMAIVPETSTPPAEYRVVLNWFEELKARVPAVKR